MNNVFSVVQQRGKRSGYCLSVHENCARHTDLRKVVSCVYGAGGWGRAEVRILNGRPFRTCGF